MIEITVPSGRYSLEELRNKLSKYFKTMQDVNLFITSMQQTNQLKEVEPGVFETAETKKDVSKTREYRTITDETPSDVAKSEEYGIHTFRWTFAPSRKEFLKDVTTSKRWSRYGKYYVFANYKGEPLGPIRWSPDTRILNDRITRRAADRNLIRRRVAVRAGKEWVEDYGTPVQTSLSRIRKDGKWIDIPEKPALRPAKSPRYPDTIEAYRAEIPAEIVQKYNITGDTDIYLRIDRRVENFVTELQLYGFRLHQSETFDYPDKDSRGERYLELKGNDFILPIKRDMEISRVIDSIDNKTLRIIESWLQKFDGLYWDVVHRSRWRQNTEAKGLEKKPLRNKSYETQKITFSDLETGETKGRGEARLPSNWREMSVGEIVARFTTVSDNVLHGRKDAWKLKLQEEGF